MGLRVIEQFGAYKVGDLIADGPAAAAILASSQAAFVLRVADAKTAPVAAPVAPVATP